MKLSAFLLLSFLLRSSAFATAPTPADFVSKAIATLDVNATNVKIVTTYDPFKYASRVLQYIDRAGQRLGDSQQVAWSFYRVQYTDRVGTVQDCAAGIGYKLGYAQNKRLIDIEQCNEDFIHSTTRFQSEVEL